MNWLIIEQILERFWEGNTTLDEEKQLKSAFLRDDVPAHLRSYIGYFTFVNSQKKIVHPQKDFEKNILANLKSKPTRTFKLPKQLAYAASFLLLIGSLYFLLKTEKAPLYEPLTAKEMQVAEKYLNLMSKNIDLSLAFSAENLEKFNLLNKGSETIQQYEKEYKKQIKNLKQVNYIDQSFNQLKHLQSIENSKIKL